MMNLIKYEDNNGGALLTPDKVQKLEGFNKMLNEDPASSEIQINEYSENSKYLPISFVQSQLDEFYAGLWETKNFQYSVIANEIVGSITLRVFHPVANTWIERQGAAAVQIQMKSAKKGGSGDITNIRDKITNTLGKDFPHLAASCLANAARSLGKKFGRDLNRKHEDDVTSFYGDMAQADSALVNIEWDKVKTMADLKAIWSANKPMQANKHFAKSFAYHRARLEAKQ